MRLVLLRLKCICWILFDKSRSLAVRTARSDAVTVMLTQPFTLICLYKMPPKEKKTLDTINLASNPA